MKLIEAQEIYIKLKEMFEPHCEVIKVCGSVRRFKPEVHDLEIIAIPKKWHLEKFLMDNSKLFWMKKNGPKYKQFIFEGQQIDLFITKPDNFGLIFLIRTGSRDFSEKALARWKKVSNGGESHLGYLRTANGDKVLTPTEQDVFARLGWDFIEPDKRN